MYTEEQMINYLQSLLSRAMYENEKYGVDERTEALFDRAIYCKEMVETLIQKPVNLRKDGKVTVGF